jgi:uncharacterized protein YcnI
VRRVDNGDMPHHRRRRVLTAALVFGSIVALAPATAFAHVEFEDAPASVAPNTDIDLTLHVPNERAATNFNVGVAVQLPEGWTGVVCVEKPTWTCEMTTESDRVVVHFDKDEGAAAAEDETFEFTLHSSATLGTATFPTIQTYDTGEEVAWIGEPDSDEPAPTLEVAEGGATTTSAATATTTAAPETTAAATTLAPSDSTTPEATTPAAPDTTAVTAETTVDTVTILETTVTTAADSDDDDGNTGAIIAIAILAIVAAIAGTIIYLRRRKPTVPPTMPPTAGGPPNAGV